MTRNSLRPRTLALAMSLCLLPHPARADEICLKSGQILKGQVVSEGINTVGYERGDRRYFLNKEEIAILETATPWVVLLGGTFVPAGGQLLLGDPATAVNVFGAAALAGGAVYGLTRQVGMKNAQTIPASIAAAAVIWIGGAVLAYFDASNKANHPKLKIQLEGDAPRAGVGELLAPRK